MRLIPSFVTRTASQIAKQFRSLRDVSVYADAVNSLVSLANVSTTAGQAINERTAISLISVFAAVRNIADDVAKTERAVFRKEARGKSQVFDHPMHRIICQSPNPEMGPMDFFRALIGSACLFGNGYAQIIRDKYTGLPIHAYPLHPWRVRCLRDETGMLFYSVDGCRRVEIGDMIHIKNFGTNGVLGIMTIRSAKESLGLTLALEQYGSSFFGNSALPKGVFYTDGVLSEEAQERLRKKWDARHRGAGQAHGTAVMEHGLKWQQMSVANNEGQFLESRAFQILEVCRLWRLPPHKLGDVSKGTMNNMEQQNGEYVQDCLMSWYIQIEEEIKRKLTRPDEVTIYPKFLVRSFFRGDMKARQEFYASGIQWGYLNRNDCREMEDLNPVDGLDTFLVPQNFSAASALETMTKSQLTMLALHAKTNGVALDDNGFPLLTAKQDDGSEEVDEQADPAEQVVPEPNVAPPPGIVLPGTQPIDDSFFGRSKKLAEAQAPLLADAFRRLLHTEADKVTRAAKKEDFEAWRDGFYGKHPDRVRSIISPVIRSIAQSVWALDSGPTDEQRAEVEEFITAAVAKHTQESRSDVTDLDGIEQRVAHWEEARSESSAKDRIKELLELLCPAGAKS